MDDTFAEAAVEDAETGLALVLGFAVALVVFVFGGPLLGGMALPVAVVCGGVVSVLGVRAVADR